MTNEITSPLPPDDRAKLRALRPSDSLTPDPDFSPRYPLHQSRQQSIEVRTPYQKDLDRLLYNYYTRRLARVTQVAAVAKRLGRIDGSTYQVPHNRLTHSLKVGQVARRTAHYLAEDIGNTKGISAAGGIDFDIAEFAGRAHDIGHPPFGHAGEEALSELAKSWGLEDGFEGNAQTFRILTYLTSKFSKDQHVRGLDLTYASTASVVKYPWDSRHSLSKKKKGKFGYYDVDAYAFKTFVQPLLYTESKGTLEAQIMDWADDVSYAVHDVEDFAFQGKIPVYSLTVTENDFHEFWLHASSKLEGYSSSDIKDIQALFRKTLNDYFSIPLDDTEASQLRMAAFVSAVIERTSRDTSVTHTGALAVRSRSRGLVEALKHLTWHYVINRPELHSRQQGDTRVLKAVASELYRIATETCSKDTSEMEHWLATPLVESIENSVQQYTDSNVESFRSFDDDDKTKLGVARGVIDYVASLTEDDVFGLYELYGLSAAPIV